MPDLQPTLTSNLLILRPLHADDFEALYAAASDPLIWQQHPCRDRYMKEVFKKFFQDALSDKGAVVVLDAKSKEIIGSSRYYEVDLAKREVVIGYTFLKRSYWGGVYNKELKSMMLTHAFKFFDAVLFHVDEFNFRSQKAMEKIGGLRCGEFKKLKQGGGLRNVFIYRCSNQKKALE